MTRMKEAKINKSNIIQQFMDINFQRRVEMFAFPFIVGSPHPQSLLPGFLLSIVCLRVLLSGQSWEVFQLSLLACHVTCLLGFQCGSENRGEKMNTEDATTVALDPVLFGSGLAPKATRNNF